MEISKKHRELKKLVEDAIDGEGNLILYMVKELEKINEKLDEIISDTKYIKHE